jgi:predicted ArsR family transcriptional regulator
MSSEDASAAVAAVATLSDPTRRALYRYVAAQGTPVGREQAAAAVGVAPHVARFHLDRLHDAGLLEVEFKRPEGRGGPGAGRPTKLYRPTAADFAVSVPERRYDIAGLVLSRAVAAALDKGAPLGQALEEAADEAGRAIGRQARPPRGRLRRTRAALNAAVERLEAFGFRPRADGDCYVLSNCPFRGLAQEEPDVMCRMNLALVRGLLDEVGVPSANACLEPAEGRCCVTVQT